jgi:mannose-6-phosphate isomerase-like protein (cupin superfamily)
MAYIFQEDKLPKLVSVVPGRERTFFVNKELTQIDDMLAGIMHYVKGGSSPYHLHKNCEHFYFIMQGHGTVESEEGARDVGPEVSNGAGIYLGPSESATIQPSAGASLKLLHLVVPKIPA